MAHKQEDAGYPPVLLQAQSAIQGFQAPPVLHVRGKLLPVAPQVPTVAVIGARACTPAGRRFAFRLGAQLADAGIQLVSGAARGIDQAAMRGAQQAGGRVLAVLGSGLARPYPHDALDLLCALAQGSGAVVSEFAAEMAPLRHHFLQRNRLIAAFSQLVLVVQAGQRSGTMNTVSWALELGREIAAVPGPPGDPRSAGPHRLLREGALLVESAQDVAQFLGLQLEAAHEPASAPSTPRQQLLHLLRHQALSFDELLRASRLPATELQVLLGRLELDGLIQRGAGGAYHRSTHR